MLKNRKEVLDTMYTHKCIQCGEAFISNKKEAKYCGQDCYKAFRRKNAKLINRECPICHKLYKPHDSGITYCSRICAGIARQNRIECTCELCGKKFERIKSEVDKNTQHFCSKKCRYDYIKWDDKDLEILKKNYSVISNDEISDMLSKKRSNSEIKRKALELDLASFKLWTKEEISLLIDTYSYHPIDVVMQLLPNKSYSSILRQAQVQNIKSFTYLSREWTKEDTAYLTYNYEDVSYEDMAKHLNRTVSSVKQRMIKLGLRKHTQPTSYTSLYKFIRSKIKPYIISFRRANNYTCALTGCRSNIVVHHIHGFIVILDELLQETNFPIFDNFSMYTDEQLSFLVDEFLKLQEKYDACICITEDIHKQLHSIYGYGSNTREQWDEFVELYYNN